MMGLFRYKIATKLQLLMSQIQAKDFVKTRKIVLFLPRTGSHLIYILALKISV